MKFITLLLLEETNQTKPNQNKTKYGRQRDPERT